MLVDVHTDVDTEEIQSDTPFVSDNNNIIYTKGLPPKNVVPPLPSTLHVACIFS